MPTPIDILLDPVSLGILAMYGLLMLWEALFPARPLPYVAGWKRKGILFFFGFFFLSTYLPLWYAEWLPTAQLVNLSGVHPVLAAITGVLLYEFGMYVWHRLMHRNDWLWKICHQMHHSAERLDTYGAFYFSPFDMVGWTLLGTVCFSLILGLPAASVTLVLLITNFFSIFQHANIKTPAWLGYIIQRPESHAVHHARGVHAYNYSDLPLFDILFGTFRNPEQYVPETGFYPGASGRMTDMMLFRDVSAAEPVQPEEKEPAVQ
ncbi:MAG TPA: sterol desaturase family protein [Chitinophagaceae bacterium]|jgi:sterol desaturase/sphingolipid hydroxylase (fatty acid hydroxylase superfamily)|nr:sterol desaturase family protein [Chitinophagaceae bacterium]